MIAFTFTSNGEALENFESGSFPTESGDIGRLKRSHDNQNLQNEARQGTHQEIYGGHDGEKEERTKMQGLSDSQN
jgi:hypothetical protein